MSYACSWFLLSSEAVSGRSPAASAQTWNYWLRSGSQAVLSTSGTSPSQPDRLAALTNGLATDPLQFSSRLLVDLGEEVPVTVIGERDGTVTGTSRNLRGINTREREQRDASVLQVTTS